MLTCASCERQIIETKSFDTAWSLFWLPFAGIDAISYPMYLTSESSSNCLVCWADLYGRQSGPIRLGGGCTVKILLEQTPDGQTKEVPDLTLGSLVSNGASSGQMLELAKVATATEPLPAPTLEKTGPSNKA